IHCCYAAAPHLDAAKNGRIVSVIGDSSRVGESGLAIVAAARAGVVALMKSLARELGRSGTTANTVSLGLVETPHDMDWVDANRDAETSVTNADLFERTANLAGHLADAGIGANDAVAIMLPNSVAWAESCLAIARAGAIGVPISHDSTETEIAYRLADANCRA